MVDIPTTERITGYLVGGISPFGIKMKIPVVMDEATFGFEIILINAGQRGAMLMMDPADIRKALVCQVASVAEP